MLTPTTRPAATGDLTIDGKFPKTFTAAEIAAMPHVELKVKAHDGSDATYRGVPLRALLLAAGAPIDANQMRGPNLALVLVARAADGYRVAFGLAEFDATYADRGILLANARDGKPLDAKEGPLRLVVPQEAKQGRWIRQLVRLTFIATSDELPAARRVLKKPRVCISAGGGRANAKLQVDARSAIAADVN